MEQKIYYRHSGYPGGMKTRTLQQQLEYDPRKVIEHAVKGMLPKNKIGARMGEKLFVYTNAVHPYEDKIKGKQTATVA